jgi:hypothetical protein
MLFRAAGELLGAEVGGQDSACFGEQGVVDRPGVGRRSGSDGEGDTFHRPDVTIQQMGGVWRISPGVCRSFIDVRGGRRCFRAA